MSYLRTALGIALGARLRRGGTWLAVLAVLLTVGATRWLAHTQETPVALVQVGVALPQGGELFWAEMVARENTLVRFIRADADMIARNVAASRWDCGLVLSADFSKRLADGQFANLIRLVRGPGSTVYPLVRETAAAVVLELASPVLVAEYLRENGLATKDLPENMARRRVEITMVTLDGQSLQIPQLVEQSGRRLLRGCVAVVLLVWTLFTAIDLGRWMQTPWYQRLRSCRRAESLLLPQLVAALLPALVVGALALVLAGDRVGALALLPYLAALGSWTLLLAKLRPLQTLLPAVIPLLAAAAFVLSPVVIDVGGLFPPLLPLTERLAVTLYLQAGEGSAAATGELLVMAALGAVASGWIHCRERKQSGEIV